MRFSSDPVIENIMRSKTNGDLDKIIQEWWCQLKASASAAPEKHVLHMIISLRAALAKPLPQEVARSLNMAILIIRSYQKIPYVTNILDIDLSQRPD